MCSAPHASCGIQFHGGGAQGTFNSFGFVSPKKVRLFSLFLFASSLLSLANMSPDYFKCRLDISLERLRQITFQILLWECCARTQHSTPIVTSFIRQILAPRFQFVDSAVGYSNIPLTLIEHGLKTIEQQPHLSICLTEVSVCVHNFGYIPHYSDATQGNLRTFAVFTSGFFSAPPLC